MAASIGSGTDPFAFESLRLRLRPVLLLGVESGGSVSILSFSGRSGKRSPGVLLDDWIAGVLWLELAVGVFALDVLILSC